MKNMYPTTCKAFILSLMTAFFYPLSINAQIKVTPTFPTLNDNITITYDATLGNAALNNTTPIYVHTGVITPASTSITDWKYVKYPWTQNAADNILTDLTGNKHSIAYNIRNYYGIPVGTTPSKLAMVFRNAAGTQVGKTATSTDILYDIWDGTSFESKFVTPSVTHVNIPVNGTISLEAALSQTGNIRIRVDGALVRSVTNTQSLIYSFTPSVPGTHTVTLQATNGITPPTDKTFTYSANPVVTVENPPANAKLGVTENNDGSATFVLRAPNKAFVYCLGDFNNWAFTNAGLMKKSVDGNTFWITIPNLTPQTTYLYQYAVEGTIRIADPYSKVILDPAADATIPSTSYPNIPNYPSDPKVTGFVSILEYQKTPYVWTTPTMTRHLKSDLIVYELLIRDYTTKHNFQGVIDSLQYLKNLGINAIEIMPVHEFEGNESWGYNPNFYMAVDKSYGNINKFKQLIDSCHSKGIVVILDVAFNHVFSTSPLCQLYWDAATQQTTTANPWVNRTATHPLSPGYDLNHESNYTKEYCKDAFAYWLNEFKIDGFRIDLSKGFTQTVTTDINTWSNYDQSRINILTDYYNHIQSVSPNAYVICEHLGIESEENALCANGMMVWHKKQDNYKQAMMGFASGSDLATFSPKSESWPFPKFDRPLTYGESHDEERNMVDCLLNGNQNANYSTRTLATALKRAELMAAFFYTVPGSKMLWQFGELGYDYSIDYGGRVSNKPIRWDYLAQPDRGKLYKVVANIINLRTRYPSVFRTDNHNPNDMNASGSQAWYHKHLHLSPSSASDFKVTIVGNFDIVAQNLPAYFQNTGTWYDYLSGQTLNVTNTNMNFSLAAGEYHIFLNQNITPPFLNTGWNQIPIPVELVNFTAKTIKTDILLTWNTATEINNAYFDVERSFDGLNFHDISRVKGNGTSSKPHTYTIEDKNLAQGIYYYRLKQVDFDGQTTYSKTINATIEKEDNKVLIYPNPAIDVLYIQKSTQNTEGGYLTDVMGKIIKEYTILPTEIHISDLKAGIYFLKTGSQNFKIFKR